MHYARRGCAACRCSRHSLVAIYIESDVRYLCILSARSWALSARVSSRSAPLSTMLPVTSFAFVGDAAHLSFGLVEGRVGVVLLLLYFLLYVVHGTAYGVLRRQLPELPCRGGLRLHRRASSFTALAFFFSSHFSGFADTSAASFEIFAAA